jgi:hypothetical protein
VLATANRRPEIVAIPNTTTDDIRFLLERNLSGNQSRNFRNGADFRNISDDFRNDVKSDEQPFHSNVSEISTFQRVPPVERTVDVSPEIRKEIIRLHTEGFNRTQIRDAMHLNGEQFKLIKTVLDDYQQEREG